MPRLQRFCRGRAVAAMVAIAGALPAAALGEDRGAWFAGGEIDNVSSAYAGLISPLPGARLGKGWAIRTIGSVGHYQYDRNGRRIRGRFAGADVGLTRQWSGDWGWFNTTGSGRYTDTRLSPSDPENRRGGGQGEIAVAADGARMMGRWRVQGFASYGFQIRSYQARLNLTRQAGRFRAGVEAGTDGDPTYRRRLAGLFVAAPMQNNLELQVSAGASNQSGRTTRGYVRIGLVRTF